ncbi:MAG: DUF1858 domain-containing protein [Sphaerochaetaceae bacterium]|jgi:formate-dependent phosphoribosylglycinamide formyltransferase (GAR transformylase)|nr:DUF1858 domain-containing protein [Sphaerochaetaceae bacterium]MDX9939178.1 DUF1858 domain-containing protein [Sphaerochaetaceae bacterium]
MEEKTIDTKKTVHALCTADPALIQVLAAIGFTEIVKPIMLSTVGKVMTLPKGAAMRGIAWDTIVQALQEQGYRIAQTSQEETT